MDRAAEFVNLLDMRRDLNGIGLGQVLEFARLRRNRVQGIRHPAAEYPDQRDKGRAGDDCEDQSGELQLADVLDEVLLGRQ